MSSSKSGPIASIYMQDFLISLYHPLFITVIAKYSNQQMFMNFVEENAMLPL